MDRRNAIIIGGSAIMGTALMSLLESCKQQPRVTWKPAFLSNDHAALVSAIVDTLLPRTSTPGGIDTKADIFIDKVYAETLSEDGKKSVLADITAFDDKCKKTYGSSFALLSTVDKQKCLEAEETSSPRLNGKVWGTTVGDQKSVGFYRGLKSMAVWAYCTSMEIGKNVLNYDPVPGEYIGCVELKEIGRVWSL